MTMLRIIGESDVERLLTMDRCIEEMAAAMKASTEGEVLIPARQITPLQSGAGFFALMPSASQGCAVFGAKAISLFPNNRAQGVPAIQGFICLFEDKTGAPLAIIDGASVTAIRTAAASGLATKLLAREDVETHTVIGTGVQAVVHAQAICAARPGIMKTLIWGRNAENAKKAAEEIAGKVNCEVTVASDLELAARSDVISMVTAAKSPILHGKWLREGAHLNLVGPHKATEREADTETILRARVYVDLLESAKREAGEILIPIEEGIFSLKDIVGEIGAVVAGTAPGRQSESDITLYKSVGVASQDLYAAAALLRLAEEANAGAVVSL